MRVSNSLFRIEKSDFGGTFFLSHFLIINIHGISGRWNGYFVGLLDFFFFEI